MRPKDFERARGFESQLQEYSANRRPLPGIEEENTQEAFVEQLIDSIRRNEYIGALCGRDIDARRCDPSSDLFDPLKAAIVHHRQGRLDEACWLVFLSVHFGKHKSDGWRLTRAVYGSLGNSAIWDWDKISNDLRSFRPWLLANTNVLNGDDGVRRRFGNHRKYQSLKATHTPNTVETFVDWVGPDKSFREVIRVAHENVGQHPREAFDFLYRSMDVVAQFGRLAKFDYFTMLSKLGLAPIEAGSTYMCEATGPLRGARLLFGGNVEAALNCRELDQFVVELEAELGVGMQAMEDSLCNWQKSPSEFIYFGG